MHAGTGFLRAGDFAAAARDFRRALETRPHHPGTLQTLAGVLLRAGKPEEACSAFDRLTRLAPGMSEAWHGLGLARHAKGNHAGALLAFRHSVRVAPTSWRSWQSIADITPSEAERRAAIRQACQSLKDAAGRDPHKIMSYVNALRDAHDFSRMAAFIEANWTRFPSRAQAYERHAHALYNMGHYSDAFVQMKEALKATTEGPSQRVVNSSRFTPSAATDALQAVYNILTGAGLVCFPAAGTLLGLVRTGAPLAHDRDIDIGVLQQDGRRPDIAGLIRRHPALILERRARPGDRYFALNYQGIAVDIFLYTPIGEHVVCGFSDRRGDIAWRYARFGLCKARFGRFAWPVPENAEHYLAQTYGPGWSEPDPGFASVVSAPALYPTNPYARAFYAAGRARRSLLAGDADRARALAARSPLPLMEDLSTL
ncbi:tetratricopeptide repeat protein [Henriciella aquimarina]|uniref:tetratricopeptide repeat protein n=1 Tax=Henriciella aquimarina TaxID=545261 RepID=UPI001301FB14|nr:tetratricopeptide repeat protein [Henriciella aquimarina]